MAMYVWSCIWRVINFFRKVVSNPPVIALHCAVLGDLWDNFAQQQTDWMLTVSAFSFCNIWCKYGLLLDSGVI